MSQRNEIVARWLNPEPMNLDSRRVKVVGLTELFDAIVAISIAAGAIFTIVELRQMAKDRRTQLVISLMMKRGSHEFIELADKIWKADFKSGEEAIEKVTEPALLTVANFYEQVGLLIDRKLVDSKLVFESIGIQPIWDKMKPWAVWTRDCSRCGPRSWEHFESAAEKDRAYCARSAKKRTRNLN